MRMKYSLNYRMLHRISIWLAKSVCILAVVVLCIKFSFNPSVLKMADVADFTSREWSNPSGRKYTLNKIERDNGSTRQDTYSVASTTDVWTPDITRETNYLDTSENYQKAATVMKTSTLNSRRKSSDRLQSHTLNTKLNEEIRMKLDKSNSVVISKKLNLTYTSSKTKVFKKHPHEMDFEMIASGKYIIEDLMKQGPFKFLKNFKSPCWKPAEKSSWEPPIRCLPYFYLIGAPKSGTTDMHRRLIKHPEISKLVVKEPHWLTRRHYYGHGINGGYSNLTHYLKVFKFATRDVLLRKDSEGFHNVIFGDCSASTLWDNDYWTILPEFRNLSEPLYTNADYIHHLNPNAKIIAMLRNPVERLYSDYLFFQQFQQGSPEMFHEGVKNIIKDTYNCLRNNSLRHCLYTPAKSRPGIVIRLRIGVYHLHLKEYFRVFPREQVMVIKLEDFSNNTYSYMKQIFSFLEISTLKAKDLQKIADPNQHANKRRKKDKQAGEMLPETRKMLENFYRPHNDLLSKLLGEKFNYNRDLG
ncbi:carbohydrate sulfotransferase 15-like isoform X2 [Ruditapes philippinarum]|nr:carbohydrate sulfotransferase 15-like isoform X2 [Ruditapes philippinarum]XP_060575705.1 carbohydrate sulfotransferase 15-like isoform X2 [Ruditapes philippinarum]XP_060575706.1 carbohydrate sulfotransferase 15-like isoform X2 [Ruditapes philippinarum]XP_060575708.1 carbohydrate sulfotransferase 15-like isoform X2 [Ruditapes philippinarum]